MLRWDLSAALRVSKASVSVDKGRPLLPAPNSTWTKDSSASSLQLSLDSTQFEADLSAERQIIRPSRRDRSVRGSQKVSRAELRVKFPAIDIRYSIYQTPTNYLSQPYLNIGRLHFQPYVIASVSIVSDRRSFSMPRGACIQVWLRIDTPSFHRKW